MLFDAGEFVLLTEHSVPTGNGKEVGNLILTNKRLALETTRSVKSGLFGKQKQDFVVINIPLTSILIADKKKDFIFKKHEFSINADGSMKQFSVNEPQVWITQIAAAKSGNVTQGGMSVGTSTSIVINPQSSGGTQQQPEQNQIVREVIKVRCTGCKNLVDEEAKFCPVCGEPVKI
ncbi:MAG: hypothetical protein M1414_03720 [Candidatus Thermoplasmatota archaeon]|jgi:hypothetical protein|nr:hypothetical protein [Candidatus Thermoplasmatota archaeon]MCL5987998.1 hypothetical protein [Candidatus Thermoplasmatota archaeon]